MAESSLIGLIKQTSPSSRNRNSNSSREKNLSLCSSCFRSRDLGNIITRFYSSTLCLHLLAYR
ncbi:unnamed protein product [Brassica oleracea]